MKVVQVNTADLKGGAGIAAYRLHCGFRSAAGIESRLLVGIKVSSDEDVVPFYRTRVGYMGSRIVHRILCRLGLEGTLQFPIAFSADRLLNSADLIHLHHIHGGFFSYPSILKRAKNTPVVWTLHDMWSFTGSCAYAYDCVRWRSGCGSCPQLAGERVLDFTARQWRMKKQTCLEKQLTIVTPSKWLAGLAKESPIHRHLEVKCIPNGVETSIFHPMDRAALRRVWRVPEDSRVILAQVEHRKGTGRILPIMKALPERLRKQLFLVLVGQGAPEDLLQLIGPEHVLLTGYIAEQSRMAECYALADLFLLPTEADNLPNTLLECIACGTPAVTFDVGGCPEVIRHLETGYVARAGDSTDIARGIEGLLGNVDLLLGMRNKCRRLAISQFDVSVTVNQYVELYLRLASKA